MSRLNSDDSGTYSCRAVNPYGSINASFAVQVLGKVSIYKSVGGESKNSKATCFNSIITLSSISGLLPFVEFWVFVVA